MPRGWPGIPPRWTSSAKTGVGTALNQHSKVWFTLSHGILNEVYFPRVDQACTRDIGFIVTDGRDFFSEEKRHCTFENQSRRARRSRFRTDQHRSRRTLPDSQRSSHRSLPQRRVCRRSASSRCKANSPTTTFTPCSRRIWPTAATTTPAGSATTKACPCSSPSTTVLRWLSLPRCRGKKCRSDSSASPTAGRIFRQHFQMEWEYQRAENGNIACTGEIDLAACNGEFVLALGFGAHLDRGRTASALQSVRRLRRDFASTTSSTGRTGRTRCSSSTNRKRAVRSLSRLDRGLAHA